MFRVLRAKHLLLQYPQSRRQYHHSTVYIITNLIADIIIIYNITANMTTVNLKTIVCYDVSVTYLSFLYLCICVHVHS